MENLGIEFSKMFCEKHGKKVFQEIVKQIEQEYNGKCDTNYIDAVFSISFITYLGITDINKIHLLCDISKDTDIKNLLKLHRKAILKIQKYIKIQTNKK